ncbi:MAG: SDR family oxidoreductase [Alphaproteobacteria bacterium]|jgi:NAD(P)-dependent dehydrogenase (short-subunit alcohol dehydrogenase family)|nr:SDR family oxidoreductase [Alphaproteobacteria bacterium]MBU1551547.1 SDR family oxidoreductase [Alphaproteobacteria bacterium]MBU2337282.1 SDR family oxidoreductase [Alphaproteobacteria bacterium]MBU2388025.1 SDR family oxidoreductase [Alphaproteobacteria bacterium]
MTDPFSFPPGFSAVVIGGAGDIGSAIASLFHARGASVTATGHDRASLDRSTLSTNLDVALEILDVRSDAAVNAFAARFERVDALVNCAGILARDEEFEIETFQRVLDVNLTGTFRTSSAFRRHLAARGGSIVNIASMNAYAALPRIPAYCASKGGVVMLTKALALAWADEGIRVNAVAPGYIETAINAEGRKDTSHHDRIAARTALKRWGTPDEVAGTVVFLAMPASKYATGTVFAVDGGFLAG